MNVKIIQKRDVFNECRNRNSIWQPFKRLVGHNCLIWIGQSKINRTGKFKKNTIHLRIKNDSVKWWTIAMCICYNILIFGFNHNDECLRNLIQYEIDKNEVDYGIWKKCYRIRQERVFAIFVDQEIHWTFTRIRQITVSTRAIFNSQ